MTMNTSAATARTAAAASSSNFSGCNTEISRFKAHSFTSDAASSNPRPFFLSGAVATSKGTSPAFSSSSRNVLASRGVPKKTKRRLLFIPFIFFIHGCCFVSVEDALKMIHFVLKNVRKKIGCAAREALSVFIIRSNSRFLGARDGAPESPYRKSSFVFFFFRTRYLCHLRIYIYLVVERCRNIRFFAPFVRSVPRSSRERASGDDEKTHRLADLRRRERNAIFFPCEEGLHFFNKTLNVLAFYVGNTNRLRFFPQCRVLFLGQNGSHWRNYTRKLKIKRAARGGSNWSGPE